MYTKMMIGSEVIIIRDDATKNFIPLVNGNYDYQKYLDWVAEPGNTAAEEQITQPS